MRNKTFFIILLSIVFIVPCMAADNDNWTCTTSLSGDTLACVPAAGFANLNTSLLTGWTKGMYVDSIEFTSSAASDKLVIRDGSSTGAVIMSPTDILGGGLIKYFNQYMNRMAGQGRFFYKPYIKSTDVTFSTPASVRVIFHAVPVAKAGP